MFDLNTLEDLNLLAETAELECKLAQGQSGKGEVPKDFWPTYSGKPSLAVSSEATAPGSPISSPISSSKTEDRILQMLRDDPKCSAQQLGNALGISKRAVLKQIEKLKQQGRLSRIGSAKGGHWEVLK